MKNFFRADLYRILAQSLARPTAKMLEELKEILADLLAGLPSSYTGKKLRKTLENFAKQLKQTDAVALAGEHQRLFVNQTDCPASEGSYHLAERGPVLGDITAFYSAFGLKFIPGEGPPDAMKMELAFMSFLALKEAHALQKNLAVEMETTKEAQKKFLRDHLGRWGEIFARRLQASTPLPYYQTLAVLLKTWLKTEQRFFAVQPVPLPVSLPGLHDENVSCTL